MTFPLTRQTFISILSALLLLVALSPVRLYASVLTLAWDSNTEDDLAGYKIYYGTLSGDYDFTRDVGDVTQYTVRGLEPETRYYLALTAYDFSGNESDFSGEVSAVTESGGSYTPIPEDESGGCFIATAAYGSYLNPHVKVLRDFRDAFLMPSSIGRTCVRLYYQHSPGVARTIEKYSLLRSVTRQTLLPMIGMSSLSLKTVTSLGSLLLLLSFLISLLALRLHWHRVR